MLSFSCTLTSRILYIFDSYFGDTIFIDFKILTNNIPLLRCHYFSNILSYMLYVNILNIMKSNKYITISKFHRILNMNTVLKNK